MAFILIFLTNRCNKSCGGCYQQCNNIPKEETWDISIPELKRAVDFCIENKDLLRSLPEKPKLPYIALIGGEPTTHPQFEEILDFLYGYDGRMLFVIYVNHSRGVNKKNVLYRPDNKHKHGTDHNSAGFVPTLISPTDTTGIQDKTYHFQQAKQHCTLMHCGKLIFKGKIYQCQAAAMFDTLLKRDVGWPLERESLLKTKEGSKSQLIDFCCRCAWSTRQKPLIKKQSISDTTLISPHNADLPLRKVRYNCPRFL
jgi:hypothetical protein